MRKRKWIENWFSNFKYMDEPFFYQGIAYRTVENFFQAMKTRDINTRRIIAAASPSEAKRLGKQVQIREDWEDLKVKVMHFILKIKFAKGTTWYVKLMETTEEEIVEYNNWHDNEWGHCVCPRCINKQKNNKLGKLLTQIREEFKTREQ